MPAEQPAFRSAARGPFHLIAIAAGLFSVSIASADLEPFKDYDISDTVRSVTTIKVDSNMGDAYLEGIRNTWASGMEVSKDLGQIEDYFIYASELPESGEFNLLLVVRFANDAALAPNEERYDAFMQAFGKARSEETTEFAQENYPAMRTITGEYRFRQITLK